MSINCSSSVFPQSIYIYCTVYSNLYTAECQCSLSSPQFLLFVFCFFKRLICKCFLFTLRLWGQNQHTYTHRLSSVESTDHTVLLSHWNSSGALQEWADQLTFFTVHQKAAEHAPSYSHLSCTACCFWALSYKKKQTFFSYLARKRIC